MALNVYAGPQHTPPSVNPTVDDEEVVIAWKCMLVHQMAATLLPICADLFAAFYEAGVRLPAGISFAGHDRIVVLADVQIEEVGSGQILAALGAAIRVRLLVMCVIFVTRLEIYWPVRR